MRIGTAIAVCHGNNLSRCARPIRRQMAVGRAFKQWYLREKEVGDHMQLELRLRESKREMQSV